jgi:CBS-domain-containing membrane protein
MKRKQVKDFRPYDPPSIVHEEADLIDLIRRFVQDPCLHHVCVVNRESRLMGLINRKRMFQNVFSHHVAAASKVTGLFTLLTAETSGQLMITHVLSTTEESDIDGVIETLIEHDIRELPVLDADGRVMGFIGIQRIMKAWLDDREEAEAAAPPASDDSSGATGAGTSDETSKPS